MSRSLVLVIGFLAAFPAAPEVLGHGSVSERIGEATERIERDPGCLACRAERGHLYALDEKWSEAAKDYRAVLRLDPHDIEVRFLLARALIRADRIDAALPLLEEVLARAPNHEAALLASARALAAVGRAAESAAVYERLEDCPASKGPELLVERSRVLARLGDGGLARAIGLLDEAAARTGNAALYHSVAAELLQAAGDYDGALVRLRILADRPGRNDTWLMRRADLYRQLGRDKDAYDAYLEVRAAIDRLPVSRRNARATRDRLAAVDRALESLRGAEAKP